jgi:hypothetical protein
VTTLSEPSTRASLEEEALFREAKRRERRRRLLAIAAVLIVTGGVLGGFAASVANPPTHHRTNARQRPSSAAPGAPSSTKTSQSSVGPYVMPDYFGRLSGHELWVANGLHFYLSRDGTSFTLTKIPKLSGDLASSLLAVAAAGPGIFAVGTTTGRGFGTCDHPAPPDRTTSEFQTAGIAVTINDGRSWTTAPLPECGIVTSLSLVNGHDGFALTGPGGISETPTLLDATTDGGRSWHVVGPAPAADEVTFVSASRGIGVESGDHVGAQIERTTDGGRRWESVNLPKPRAYRGDDVGVGTPTFFNADDGVIDLVPETNGNVRLERVLVDVTHDGGRSWTTVTTPVQADLASDGSLQPAQPGQPQLVPFSAVSMRTWVLFLGPVLYETTDGGASWTRVTPKPRWPAGLVTAVTFANASLGWAFAGDQFSDGQVLVTRNGGRMWRAISSLTT